MNPLSRLALWYLKRRNELPGPPLGVSLAGNCIAVGDRYQMEVSNPSGCVGVFMGSVFLPAEKSSST